MFGNLLWWCDGMHAFIAFPFLPFSALLQHPAHTHTNQMMFEWNFLHNYMRWVASFYRYRATHTYTHDGKKNACAFFEQSTRMSIELKVVMRYANVFDEIPSWAVCCYTIYMLYHITSHAWVKFTPNQHNDVKCSQAYSQAEKCFSLNCKKTTAQIANNTHILCNLAFSAFDWQKVKYWRQLFKAHLTFQ